MSGAVRRVVVARITATLGLLVVVALGLGAGRPTTVRRSRTFDQVLVDVGSVGIVLASLFGAAVVVWIAWPKRGNERERRVARRFTSVLQPLVIVVVLALAVAAARRRGDDAPPASALAPTTQEGEAPSETDEDDPVEPRWRLVAAATAAVLAGGGAATMIGWRRRFSGSYGAVEMGRDVVDDADPLADLVSASRAALDADPDPRRGVLAAHAAMESLLAAHGLERRRWETAYEHVERAVVTLGGAADAARPLTALFAIARYSTRPITEDDRLAARRWLDDLDLVLTTVR